LKIDPANFTVICDNRGVPGSEIFMFIKESQPLGNCAAQESPFPLACI